VASCIRDIHEYFTYIDKHTQVEDEIIRKKKKLVQDELKAINHILGALELENKEINFLQQAITKIFKQLLMETKNETKRNY